MSVPFLITVMVHHYLCESVFSNRITAELVYENLERYSMDLDASWLTSTEELRKRLHVYQTPTHRNQALGQVFVN